jgi:glycosyltransferase involved in cell wall biosynthesis
VKDLTITVAICTRNRPQLVRALLDQLENQTIEPNQIMVVENTVENQFLSQDFLEKKFLSKKIKKLYFSVVGKNVAVSRNIVLKKISTDIALFLDDDVLIPKDFLLKIKNLHKKYPEFFGFTPHISPLKNDIFSLYTSMFFCGEGWEKTTLTPIKTTGFSALSLRVKSLKKEKKYFDEKLDTGEDVDFLFSFTQKGYKLCFVPFVRVKSDFLRGSILSFFKRFYSYAKFLPILHKKHPKYFTEIHDYVPKKKIYWLLFPAYFFLKPLSQSLYLQKELKHNLPLLIPSYLQHLIYMFGLFFSKEGFVFFRRKFVQDFAH